MCFNCKRYTVGLLLFAILLLSFGCGGGASPSTNIIPVTSSFTVSGKTSLNGTGLAGITVTITGAGSGSKTTDAAGIYSFTGLPNGDCTITPSIAGYTFFPVSQTITIANGDVTVPEFTATAISSSFTVSGKVSLDGTGLPGVTVTIAGAGSGSKTTDAAGIYTFTGLPNGECTITPSIAGHSFTPLSRAITVANSNNTVPEFTATATTSNSTISGKVSLNNTGLAGVIVTITGAVPGSFITVAGGNYTFSGVPNGNSTITPSLAGYSFTPVSQVISVANVNVAVPEFTATSTIATPSTFTVSGKVSLNGTGFAKVTVNIALPGGFVIGSFITDASGNYSFTGVRNGDYTVTPSIAGYGFTPPNKAINVASGNVTVPEFTATATGTITFTF